jgi:DNA invertase Pin-like site-specific DNA recombinase
MAKLHLYGRVSTDDQATSVSVQVRRLQEYAATEGTEVAGLYVDEDVSGAKPLKHRPAGKQLWDAVAPGDVVVFMKVDRAFRSLSDAVNTLEIWQQLGVSVRILDCGVDLSTPAGQLFFSQLVGFAQFERALISQRLKDAVAQCKREKRPFANLRPYGWQRVGTGKAKRFEPLEEERQLAKRVVAMRDAGMEWSQISTDLIREGVIKPGKAAAKRQGNYRGVWYLDGEVRRLYRAAVAGFPIAPRDAVAGDSSGSGSSS